MQYNKEKFLIVKYMKKFILDLDDLLNNCPKKDYCNKDLIYKESLNILELIYNSNYIDVDNRKNIQIMILSKINMLDFYIERLYLKKYISQKQLLKKISEIEKINNAFNNIKKELTLFRLIPIYFAIC